ncbi:MAG: dihydroorotate dehydrogenase (quinone), partial [Bacteroidetes bacterium RIFCSPHIGHO2_02_FULL_44_7]
MHHLTVGFARSFLGRTLIKLWGWASAYEHPSLGVDLWGHHFSNPVGLAAGFDKDAELVQVLPYFGFGFIEVGTITPLPQPGNPKPRVFRLPQDHALINRLGFNSKGAESAAKNLKGIKRLIPVAVSIGRNKETSNTGAWHDYELGLRIFAGSCDFIVINISSPNTEGLRDLFETESLNFLLQHLSKINSELPYSLPMFLKIPPDLPEERMDKIAAAVKAADLQAVVAVNLTTMRNNLQTSAKIIEKIGPGGLSGRPMADRSTETIRYLFKKFSGTIPIIGAGGIFSAEDAYKKIKAGASLVQVYTGMIYEGPGVVNKIKKGLVEL